MLKEETQAEEPSVIIVRRPCALLDKSTRPAMVIDQESCTSCKRCMKLACPAIALKGEEVVINYTQCSGCELCMKVCRFGAIKKAGESNE